jgi:tetratricopeptide (TPR) repeat protein
LRTSEGELNQAIADYTKAIWLDPANPAVYAWRASSYAEKGDHSEAIADYTNTIQLDPNDENAYTGRAFCYFVTSEQDKAIADFNEASSLEPKARLDPVTAHVCERIICDCTKAIRLDPSDSVAYYNRSWRYAQKGEYESEQVRIAVSDQLFQKADYCSLLGMILASA